MPHFMFGFVQGGAEVNDRPELIDNTIAMRNLEARDEKRIWTNWKLDKAQG